MAASKNNELRQLQDLLHFHIPSPFSGNSKMSKVTKEDYPKFMAV